MILCYYRGRERVVQGNLVKGAVIWINPDHIVQGGYMIRESHKSFYSVPYDPKLADQFVYLGDLKYSSDGYLYECQEVWEKL